MCLIVIGYKAMKNYPLIVAANRDEFHHRPAAPLHHWKDQDIIAGRDEEKGGTWMGITKTGKFAAVTNVRSTQEEKGLRSRGEIVTGYLQSEKPTEFLTRCQLYGDNYAGYNLVAGDCDRLFYSSNQNSGFTKILSPGVYGLSNASLNTPWPKVQKAKQKFSNIIASFNESEDIQPLFEMLSDGEKAEEELPDTGVDKELEYNLSSIFIDIGKYGTRAQTVLFVRSDGEAVMEERTFGRGGKFIQRSRMAWNLHCS